MSEPTLTEAEIQQINAEALERYPLKTIRAVAVAMEEFQRTVWIECATLYAKKVKEWQTKAGEFADVALRNAEYILELEPLLKSKDDETILLRELLAVLHRDGGHYTAKHGIKKSVEDAYKVYYELRAKDDRWEEVKQTVEKALEEIDKEATMFQAGSHELGVRQGRNNACNWFLSLLSDKIDSQPKDQQL